MVASPAEFRLRMYNVGFGDSFLLTFRYDQPIVSDLDPDNARTERNILVDFGSSSGARSRLSIQAIAKLIAADSGGRLDAVVISHRHRDHISGFGSATSAKAIAALDPLLVVRSWTENPRLGPNSGQLGSINLADDLTDDAAYLGRLAHAQQLAEDIVGRAKTARRGMQSNLVQAASVEVPPNPAVTELARLSKGKRGEYLSAGMETRLNEVAPGVQFRVIGPPRPKQWPPVAQQAAESNEFWLSSSGQISRLFSRPSARRGAPLGTARWIMESLLADESRQLTGLVEWLDDALNNTSVVLLVTVDDHVLLLGGDAQIENWGWSLKQAESDQPLRDALSKVTVYKVGHHGSRNGTPKSLYSMWENRPQGAMISMMSTKHGVHGKGDHAVPRTTLIDALRERGQLLSTDDGTADWLEVRVALPSGQFEVSQAPVP